MQTKTKIFNKITTPILIIGLFLISVILILGFTNTDTAFAEYNYDLQPVLEQGGVTYTQIGETEIYTVTGCDNIASINIVESIFWSPFEGIGYQGFVHSISDNAFKNCTNLTTVTFELADKFSPPLVASIGASAFENCTSLTTIKIPYSVTTIGNSAFKGCTSLNNEFTYDGDMYALALNTIGDNAFEGCTSLTSLTIPKAVASIGSNVFLGCTYLNKVEFDFECVLTKIPDNMFKGLENLTTINMSNNIKDIGKFAFKGCISLNAGITFNNDNDVKEIEESAFEGCTSMTSLTIPNSLLYIRKNAFKNCTNLTAIPFNNDSSLYTIGERAFEGCTKLSSFFIPKNVTNIENTPFFGCSALATVTFAELSELTIIGDSLFKGCTSLSTISMPTQVTTVGVSAFEGCTNLATIAIPATVTSIGNSAFKSCIGLTNGLTFVSESNLATIGNNAFEGCTNLTTIAVPNNVTIIGEYAFSGCSALATISIDINGALITIFNNAFEDCQIININIPASVKTIGDSAFANCSSLIAITFASASQLNSIGVKAFFGCNSLASIDLPASLISIGDFAFQNLTSLTSVSININGALITIGNNAFENCPILTINIPASVKTIGDFSFSNCTYLETVIIAENSVLETIGASAFFSCYYIETIIIPDSVTSIGISAFEECDALTTATLTNSSALATLGSRAFYECALLESIIIPPSVNAIGEKTFYGCKALVNATIADNSLLSKIDKHAFYACEELISINIPYKVTSIGNFAFEACFRLVTVTFEENSWLETIGFNGFLMCYDLTTIALPKNLVTIGHDAFYRCRSLTTVTFESQSKLETIEYQAFFDCEVLTSIAIPRTVKSIGSNTFGGCLLLSSVTFEENSLLNGIEDNTFKNTKITSISLVRSLSQNGRFSIGEEAFMGCSALTQVYFKVREAYICKNAFADCSNLVTVTFADALNAFTGYEYSIGISAFSECTKLETITFDSLTGKIGDNAFKNCKVLQSINLSTRIDTNVGETFSNLSSIGANAFEGCESLTDVVFTAQLKTIGDNAFLNCTGITSLTFNERKDYMYSVGDIPGGNVNICYINYIGTNAFKGCTSLTDLDISNCVKETTENIVYSAIDIKAGAFQDCTNLTNIKLKSIVPPTLGLGVFTNSGITATTGTIITPRASLDAYKTANYWLALKSRILPNYFVVKFVDYNDTLITTQEVNYQEAAIALTTDPTRTGYTFDCWSDLTNIREDRTITAQYIIINYTIEYELNGGSVSIDYPTTYTVEDRITFATPTKKGYEFSKWYEYYTTTSTVPPNDLVVDKGTTGNRSYTAYFSIINYTISYESVKDVFFNIDNPRSFNVESEDKIISNPIENGYEFLGWTGAEFISPTKNIVLTAGSTENRTYTANWQLLTYTITYYGIEGANFEGANPSSFTVEDDDINLSNPSKDGYSFVGWSGIFDLVSEEPITSTWGSISTQFASEQMDREITANWAFKVEFRNYNGFAKYEEGYSYQKVEDGGMVTEPADPIMTNCTFVGWYTDINYTDEFDFATAIIVVTNLYEKFTTTATLSIDGEETTKILTVGKEFRELEVVRLANVDKKDGHAFIYWEYLFASPDLYARLEATSWLYYSEPLKLQAFFETHKHIVNFDTGDENVFVPSFELTFGEVVTSLPTPFREGFVFKGWYVGEDKVEVGEVYNYHSSDTLLALWEESSNSSDGGSITPPTGGVTPPTGGVTPPTIDSYNTGEVEDGGGSVIGIIVGGVLGVGALAGISIVLIKKKKKGKKIVKDDTITKE